MRILLVTSRYFPHRGGLETVIHEISGQMQAAGHEVEIVTNKYPSKLPGEERIDEIDVKRLHFVYPDPSQLTIKGLPIFGASFLLLPVTLLRLATIIARFRPDMVNLHYVGNPTLFVWLLCLTLGFKLVVSFHGGDVDEEPYKSRIKNRLFRNIVGRANWITACSYSILDRALELAPEIKSKATVIHNGVDLELFSKAPPYQHPRPYLLAVGRLGMHKGFDLLIAGFAQAARDLPDFDLMIVGEGQERAALTAQIRDAGLSDRIILMGNKTREEVASLVRGCHTMVIPSRRESFGIVGLEALAAGRPVIARRVGGLSEALEGAAVTWVTEETPEAMAAALRTVTPEISSIESLSRTNQAVAEAHSWKHVAEDYLNVYKKLS